jgi:hypothetical protein
MKTVSIKRANGTDWSSISRVIVSRANGGCLNVNLIFAVGIYVKSESMFCSDTIADSVNYYLIDQSSDEQCQDWKQQFAKYNNIIVAIILNLF